MVKVGGVVIGRVWECHVTSQSGNPADLAVWYESCHGVVKMAAKLINCTKEEQRSVMPHVTLLTPRILRWPLNFWKIFSPLYLTMYLRKRLWLNLRAAHYCGILLDGQKKITENYQGRYSMSQPRLEIDISKKQIRKRYLMNQFRLYLRLHCISSLHACYMARRLHCP